MTYAVIFTATPTQEGKGEDYGHAANQMRQLAEQQPGFLGIESATEGDTEITISYWESLQAIRDWKNHPEHLKTQQTGRQKWYQSYRVQVVKVEKEYDYSKS